MLMLFSIFECLIKHFVCLPNFALTIVFKFSWGHYIFLTAFENNRLCKILGNKQSVLWGIRKQRMNGLYQLCDKGRQCGPVVRVLALRSGDPGFKTRSDHSLNLFLVVPGSTSQLHL